jgi:hypothetical protein
LRRGLALLQPSTTTRFLRSSTSICCPSAGPSSRGTGPGSSSWDAWAATERGRIVSRCALCIPPRSPDQATINGPPMCRPTAFECRMRRRV